MQQIFDEKFSSGDLPDGWYTDTAFPEYSVGEWNCKKGDGVIIPLPHGSWSTLRLEVELIDIGANATAFVGGDVRNALTVYLGENVNGRHGASEGGYSILQTQTPFPKDERAHLAFEWTGQAMRATANGVEVLHAPNLRHAVSSGSFQTGFRDCVVTRIAAFGTESTPLARQPRALNEEYPLEVTVDFNDDLMAAAWTHQTFTNLFKELKSWGTKTVSWIDIGRREDGFFDHAPLNTGKHALETFDNVGDIFTAAVQHAHQEDIEFIGILKPFDMAIHGWSTPPFSEESRRNARIHRIGGGSAWSTHMAADHQHLLMARRPGNYGASKNQIWTRIDLVKDDDQPCAVSTDDISLWVSDDNNTFREYSGPISKMEIIEDYPLYMSTPSGPRPKPETRRARVLRFDNLHIEEPFLAFKIKGNARSFSNRLMDLVHVFGEHGEETHLTYGLSPRYGTSTPWQGGFEYNRYPGSPSGYMTAGGDPINTPLSLDRGEVSYLALAKGKDKSPLAVMSPSFPETRELWMTWVKAMLDSGADGIDLRPGHHHSDFSWIEYGFEEPIRDEMLKRTGVDIWESDDFDHNQWRKIRGEGWTQFIREASAYVRSRGKKFVAHIDGHYDNPPHSSGAMNIIWDWRSWINEGLCDGVTGKALWPNSTFSYEVLELAHKHGVTVSYAPYCNNFFEDRTSINHVGDSPEGCEIPVERLIEWGRRSGYDSFLFYECGSALRAAPDGSVSFRPNAEPLREVMQRQFR
jgi:hypothetical protein